jgi:hypothetical protein
VEKFGRTHLAWDSLGLEAHILDTRVHMLDDGDFLWRLEMTPWKI